jgi:hypothetical protein
MYNAMTDTAIRKALKVLRANRDSELATREDRYEAQEMINGMIDELIRRNEDASTSAADIRAFEEMDD